MQINKYIYIYTYTHTHTHTHMYTNTHIHKGINLKESNQITHIFFYQQKSVHSILLPSDFNQIIYRNITIKWLS